VWEARENVQEVQGNVQGVGGGKNTGARCGKHRCRAWKEQVKVQGAGSASKCAGERGMGGGMGNVGQGASSMGGMRGVSSTGSTGGESGTGDGKFRQ
jgi:hypothetical protein